MTQEIINMISPELLALVPVLNLVGYAAKKTEKIKDKYIPLIVGGCGVVLAAWYACIQNGACGASFFTGVVQGILCAGASVYANQILRQLGKKGE